MEGEVYQIVYINEDNGYTVCEINTGSDLTVAVGHMPFIAAGETVRLKGVWTTHPEYGLQFKTESLERILPQSVNAIYTYLASGAISGIGASTARKIVDRFGEETFDVIRNSPQRLSEIKGISVSKADAISEAFILRQDTAETVMFFQRFGIAPNMSMKIYKKYGPQAVEIVKDNPYTLCDSVQGIGFKICDKIAVTMGLPFDSRNRIKSGLRYSLSEAAVNGHTCYPAAALVEYASKLLGCGSDIVKDCFSDCVLSGSIIAENGIAYLPVFYNMELSVASRLTQLARSTCPDDNISQYLEEFAQKSSIRLSKEQLYAITTANEKRAIVITGGPGTGKTTIMKAVLYVMERRGLDVALCAPTGKAAKRLEEACGHQAKTIHRLLEAGGIDESSRCFAKNETNPIDADYIIVDEMSMVDLQLMDALLKAMKRGSGIIMAGDVDQLPSVGAGNVLNDIIEGAVIPVVRLSTVFRQAEESMIVVNAHRINDGKMPNLTNKSKDFFFINRPDHQSTADVIMDLVRLRLPKAYGYDPLIDIQVLSPSKKGVAGTVSLNSILQEGLNPPSRLKGEQHRGNVIFREGDKVIQIKNSYDTEWKNPTDNSEGFGVYNGDIGIVKKIFPADKLLTVEFDDGKQVEYDFASLDNLELAYALTVHKSQGGEFRAIIVPVCNFMPLLMTRNLLYTAITRAKDLVVLVGTSSAVSTMVHNNRRTKRYTGLVQKLQLAARRNNENTDY